MSKIKHIIGAGLAGCVLARELTDAGYKVILYEKDDVGGLCRDNKKYQKFVHIFHTDNKKVWDYVAQYTDIKPYKHKCTSFVGGGYEQWPPRVMRAKTFAEQVVGYSYKMWGKVLPKEAMDRIKLSADGYFFPDRHQGIPNFRKLFKNLTKGIKIVKRDVSHLDNLDNVILTGEIDRYFGFKLGKLQYRGMGSKHFYSKSRLNSPQVNFPDMSIPFLRLIDYKQLGYENYIGIEYPSSANHYPVSMVRDKKIYNKYYELAQKEGVDLVGRLAQYKYMDMDEIIEEIICR